MAEPVKETIAPPPPPREAETMDGGPAAAAAAETADLVPRTSEPAALAVVAPGEETTTTTPPPPPQEAEPTDGVASALDPALPTAEPARRAPPQEKPDAAAGQPQPPTPTKAEEVAALPPPSERPSQERVAAAVEAEKQVKQQPATPVPAPPQQQQPPQEQEGGAPEQASSVQEEEKNAAPARAQEGQEELARRRWRWLRAAVNLLFLRPKRKDKDSAAAKPPAPGGKPAVSGLEDKKTTPADKLHGEDSAGGVLDKPEVKQKDEGEGSKAQHDQTEAAPAGETKRLPLVKRLQKAGKRLLGILSWYKGHRSSGVGGEPATAPPREEAEGDRIKPAAGAAPPPVEEEEGKGDGIKPATSPDKGAGVDTKPVAADGK
ncbi:atherin-like [Panicum virgatum]|uniref:Uncharacterized protein n=1 Tax=Panicum virgatum TaxID=38727 RepID=A0A8T0X2H1_PANVG|nr:atherin-like [Panicum virgatum]XP_039789944.1 atherin-like [Panicum virgatum]KAG2651493.1 hypothetical protein PVAP13_1NG299619 [Panicum virgatum]